MESRDLAFFHTGTLVIDLLGAVVIAAYVVGAWIELLRGGGVDRARLMVANGAVFGLSFKVAASLLKSLEVHTWDQILMFATVFALRTVLKQLFMWEKVEVRPGGSAN